MSAYVFISFIYKCPALTQSQLPQWYHRQIFSGNLSFEISAAELNAGGAGQTSQISSGTAAKLFCVANERYHFLHQCQF